MVLFVTEECQGHAGADGETASGLAPFFTPPEGTRHAASRCGCTATSLPIAIGASLCTEDDFDLGGDFLDAFVRSNERIVGFLAGCVLTAGVWIICVAF